MSTELESIERLKAEWDALQPIDPDRERRLWKKLRLEWNYHSNHIEGNTLTYGETELLFLHGLTEGNHAIREYEEMKAHDAAIECIRKLVDDPSEMITEADIRGLNSIVLKERFWKGCKTRDGQPTRKEIIPGQYKTVPNNVLTLTGEPFEFASVDDTPPRMAALVAWLRETLAVRSEHPVSIVAKLHHEFVLIHPFDDGNGRVARLLVNYVLMRAGYPPIIVRSEEKQQYLTAIRKADVGDLDALDGYLAQATIRSLLLAIRAAKGESIEEPSDVEKEVKLFVRQQKSQRKQNLPAARSITDLIASSLQPFIEMAAEKLQSLAPLFRRTQVIVKDGLGSAVNWTDFSGFALGPVGPTQELLVIFWFRNYQENAPAPFDHQAVIGLHFPPEDYTITHDGAIIASKPYSKMILREEADSLTAQILAATFEKIKAKAAGAT